MAGPSRLTAKAAIPISQDGCPRQKRFNQAMLPERLHSPKTFLPGSFKQCERPDYSLKGHFFALAAVYLTRKIMKIQRALIIMTAITLGLGAANGQNTQKKAPTSKDYYEAGLKAKAAGDIDKSRQYFQAALKLDPRNANATYQLKNLPVAKMAEVTRKNALSTIILPQVRIEQSTLGDALSGFTLLVEAEAPDAVPNIVVQDPQKLLEGSVITLNVKGVPAKGVLDFILSQAGAQAKFEEYAIIVTPRPGIKRK